MWGTFAKSQLALATIEGAGLREPIPVDDPENLSIINPWTGSMADWTDGMVESNPSRENVHRILLYISTAESGQKFKLIYLFYYEPKLAGERGHVYVPGPGGE